MVVGWVVCGLLFVLFLWADYKKNDWYKWLADDGWSDPFLSARYLKGFIETEVVAPEVAKKTLQYMASYIPSRQNISWSWKYAQRTWEWDFFGSNEWLTVVCCCGVGWVRCCCWCCCRMNNNEWEIPIAEYDEDLRDVRLLYIIKEHRYLTLSTPTTIYFLQPWCWEKLL